MIKYNLSFGPTLVSPVVLGRGPPSSSDAASPSAEVAEGGVDDAGAAAALAEGGVDDACAAAALVVLRPF